jgi:hypothetical protein
MQEQQQLYRQQYSRTSEKVSTTNLQLSTEEKAQGYCFNSFLFKCANVYRKMAETFPIYRDIFTRKVNLQYIYRKEIAELNKFHGHFSTIPISLVEDPVVWDRISYLHILALFFLNKL